MPRTAARKGAATRARPAPEASPYRGLLPPASVLDESLAAEVGQERAYLLLDQDCVALELSLDAVGDLGRGCTRFERADDRGGCRIEGVDLLGARLEQDA